MKKYLLLHFGFEQPTQEIMEAWKKWFESISDRMVDRGAHCPKGVELSHDGERSLTLGPEALTGYNIIQAENLDKAKEIAGTNPFIHSIRVYELMEG